MSKQGSFNEKRLRVTLTLNSSEKAFDEKGNNTIIFDGLKVSANIQTGSGLGITPMARITIYGLSKNVINRIAKIKWNTETAKYNFIRLEALHNGAFISVYEGTINFAYPNFNTMPEVGVSIDSAIALEHQVMMQKPLSYKGDVKVSHLISTICNDIGMLFEDNGVNTVISDPYYAKPPLENIRDICSAARIDLAIENNLIAIMPKGKERMIKIPVLSPSTGLIGYPVPAIQGLRFQCLYDPYIRFGGLVEIKDSIIETANGKWRVLGISTNLDSATPNGRWYMDIQAIKG